jgi:hypothetical protein
MTRVGTLFATILPSILAGGLLFGSAPGHAESGRDSGLGFWPATPDTTAGQPVVAQADPRSRSRPWGPPVPPVPPAPGAYPVPPMPPMPPMPPRGHVRSRSHGHGMSVSIHDGKIEIDGIEELVQDQLERVGEALDSVPDMPPDVRVRIKDRVKSVRDKLGARLGKLKSMDLDKLGPEMERMGDDLERDMEGLDKDLEQLGINVGKDFAEKFGKDFAKDFARSFAPSRHDRDNSDDGDDDATDHDDDDRPGVTLDDDMVDPSDMRAAIAGLKGMMLGEDQKAQLAKLRRESEQQISDAKRDLETLSNRLHDALGDAGASEADIARQIDQISAKEATIRKARILAWVRVRSLLDKDQRTKVEAAARKHH